MLYPSRPSFDPTLPHRTVRRLRAHPDKLIRASEGPPGSPTWRQLAAGTAIVGGLAAVVALLTPGVSTLLLALLALLVGGGTLALIGGRSSLSGDWADLLMHSFWAMPAALVGVLGTHVALDQLLGTITAAVPGDAAVATLYLGASAGGAAAILRPGMTARLAAEHHDRYVLPEDFGRPYSHAGRRSEPEAHLFARLQQATDRVEEGHRVLGDSFDAEHTISLLREEEWRISQKLLHLRTLRKELVQRKREAVSPQVITALEPQEEAVARAHRALTEHVEVLTGYGERVQAAVTAHREWEQCQAIADRAQDYADLALSSRAEPAPSEEIDESLLTVEAARSIREELVREAVDMGSSLSRALRDKGP